MEVVCNSEVVEMNFSFLPHSTIEWNVRNSTRQSAIVCTAVRVHLQYNKSPWGCGYFNMATVWTDQGQLCAYHAQRPAYILTKPCTLRRQHNRGSFCLTSSDLATGSVHSSSSLWKGLPGRSFRQGVCKWSHFPQGVCKWSPFDMINAHNCTGNDCSTS